MSHPYIFKLIYFQSEIYVFIILYSFLKKNPSVCKLKETTISRRPNNVYDISVFKKEILQRNFFPILVQDFQTLSHLFLRYPFL